MPRASLSRAEEKLLHALRRRKARQDRRLFLAEGIRVAEELLDAGIAVELAVASPALRDSARGEALEARLAETTLRRVSEAALGRLATTETPQGLVLAAHMPAATLPGLDPPDRCTVLVLDAVQDPGNFGALVRSAAAFRATAVLALTGTVDPWNPKAVRAAAGASFRLPIVQTSLEAALDWLRVHAFRILAASARGRAVAAADRAVRSALIVGNEGAGVSARAKNEADALVGVPTPGPVESLNVAVAAGILLHLLTQEGKA